jgi:sugar lactone lactonase YvrE
LLESRDVPSADFLGVFVSTQAGGLDTPRGLTYGPAGDLFVTSVENDAVLRYDGASGAFEGAFVAPGSGGLDEPFDLTFGPDANGDGQQDLYVGSTLTSEVLLYSGTTGASLGAFVAAGSGGLQQPNGLAFGPDGDLLVSSYGTGQVLEYRGPANASEGSPAGEFLSVFADTGAGSTPSFITFGPDGHLYVSCPQHDTPTPYDAVIYRYDGTSGAFIDTFVPTGRGGLADTRKIVFDQQGNMLVADTYQNAVLRYQGPFGASPGAFLGSFVPSGLGGLAKPIGMVFGSDGNLYVSSRDSDQVLRYGPAKFYVVDDAAADQTYKYAGGGESAGSHALAGGNTAPRGAASTSAGDKVWVVDANRTVYVYGTDGSLHGSWSAGGLTQPQGLTVWGNDVWVVDAGSDRVFKYTGAAAMLSGSQKASSSFKLSGSNRDARGVVTDGSSFWVVNSDTTDKVFKYTLTGSLLGSWAIDAANTSPTGITLDPTAPSHLWIVDNATDRVYQYDNAVMQTSGSLSASTSFALAAGNTNPQGIADPPTPTPSPAWEALPLVPVPTQANAHSAGDAWSQTGLDVRLPHRGSEVPGQAWDRTLGWDNRAAAWDGLIDPMAWDNSEFTTPGTRRAPTSLDTGTTPAVGPPAEHRPAPGAVTPPDDRPATDLVVTSRAVRSLDRYFAALVDDETLAIAVALAGDERRND